MINIRKCSMQLGTLLNQALMLESIHSTALSPLDGKHSSGDPSTIRTCENQEISFLIHSTLARASHEHGSQTGPELTKEILVTDLRWTLRG